MSAISFGNFEPETNVEKGLTIIFLIVGVGFVGTFVGVIASL